MGMILLLNFSSTGKRQISMNNYLKSFECIRCGRVYLPDQIQYTCSDCSGNLDARYDYEAIGKVLTQAGLGANKAAEPLRLADSATNRNDPSDPRAKSGAAIGAQASLS
jgi:hypothetical protein